MQSRWPIAAFAARG